ncbi:MAG: nucleotidyl transferase AbiEii/AbiGii toxin family protein [Gemmatimonadaceae bacterium]|nr:nucleotidyl transferase AbiEii/AbiGii toxin family protein [Gemmatimonadaceae bacterium]
MDEQFEFLRSIVERLEAVGIPYMLTGSLALAIWARPRMTRDVDVVIEADAAAVERLVAAFSSDSYIDRDAALDATTSGTMFNAVHLSSLLKADFILRRDDPYERTKFARRLQVELEGRAVAVISPEDLILSKLAWARESGSARQNEDVALLLRDIPELDRKYLRQWAAALGLTEALARSAHDD